MRVQQDHERGPLDNSQSQVHQRPLPDSPKAILHRSASRGDPRAREHLPFWKRTSFHFQVRHHSGHRARYCARLQADAIKASCYRNHRADQSGTLPSPTSDNSKGLGTHSLRLTGEASPAGKESPSPGWDKAHRTDLHGRGFANLNNICLLPIWRTVEAFCNLESQSVGWKSSWYIFIQFWNCDWQTSQTPSVEMESMEEMPMTRGTSGREEDAENYPHDLGHSGGD
ncbi:interleukin-15 receptor subunit alpha isoform X4 [Callorhinus ursinus]|uniref:Interleukin-15 receptor subunit alpha isoform X6 n=1 Tax=Callorhinus ursinus TaxID=34884 RepID=A0A3Q7MQU2_CALUR|nr:interleukin-15 receptor subunit alpha isoform X6 [Callorhinus ursinus]